MQRTAIILAYVLACTNCFAQQYPFVHYTPKDGLVNSRVKKAYQDSKGRMYFLTYGGLSVYDGARFRNYTSENGLPMNIVNDVLETGNDSLLIATNSNHLSLLTKNGIETFKTRNDFYPLINQFYRHENSQIYLSSDFGLFRLEKDKIHSLNISGLTTSKNEQPNLGNLAGFGNYLILTTNEMSYNRGIFLYDITNDRICDKLPLMAAFMIGKDGNKRIWISTYDHLMILDSVALKAGKLSLVPPDKGYRQAANYSSVNVAFGKNMIWLVYRDKEFRNSELRRIDEDGNMTRAVLPPQATAAYTGNMFIDRENNIWLCNDGEGVFKIVRSPLQIIEQPFGETGEAQAGHVFYADGITWYSTLSGKIFRRSGTALRSFSSNLDRPLNIFHEEGGKISGTDGHHIYEAILPDQANTLKFQKIVSIGDSDAFGTKFLIRPDGAIISMQQSGIGIWLKNKLIFHKPIEIREKIEDIFFDKNNRLWVVYRSLGIEVFTLHPGDHSKYLQPAFKIPVEQLEGSIRSAVMDKKGLIWIGSRDRGLAGYAINGKTLEKRFHFHTGNGLTDNFVTSLACDSLNNIIAGTQSGLDLVYYSPGNPAYRVENLSSNSNLFAYINSTWADATHGYALTKSGVILQVTPTRMGNPDQSPQLLLDELRINSKPVQPWQTNFTHKENNISFLVAAPSFIDEKQVRYSYLLEGSGNDRWSDTTAVNSIINLTNLSAGKYVLKAKAFFPSGIYSPSGFSYSFEITPPWWQTWWFRSLAAVLVVGLLIVLLRYYYRKKMETKMASLERQQAIEKERTRIATDMHDDLGAGLSRIKFLSETIGLKKQLQQSFDEEISSIRNYSHEMIDKMGEIVWALNEKNDTLSDLLSYTRAYAVDYLSQNGIHCRVETPEQFPVSFVSGEFRRNIFLTIKEALHNIVKHARATEVELTIRADRHLSIRLRDNGTGFDRNMARSFSNGLTNMETRIREIGGSIAIFGDKETVVDITVPLQQ